MKPFALLSLTAAFLASACPLAATTLWNFSSVGNPLTPVSGPGVMSYYDPAVSGWATGGVSFAKASALGLPALQGGDADVMAFPACSAQEGFAIAHGESPSGVYGETDGSVSSYTLVMDVLFPSTSTGWRSLWQTNPANTDDAEFFINNVTPSGGVGIIGNYRGAVITGQWHRVVVTMRSAPGEGHCQRYIDGKFVGGIGTTGVPLEARWAIGSQFLLFTDNDGDTQPGYCASVAFLNYAMLPAEVAALGGPHAGGALTPGAAPAPLSPPMSRRVGVIGHRGGAFNRAPENTLSSVLAGIADGVDGLEVDTRVSADGVCVVMHDGEVDRTTNGTGSVSAMTVAQLKTLDAGSWFHPSFAGEQVPTLAEVLAAAKGHCFVYLDVKTPGQAAAIRAAVDATAFPQSDLWVWTTTMPEVAAIQAELPGAVIIWGNPSASWNADPNYFTNLKASGISGFSFNAQNGAVDSAFCARAKEAGMLVEVFTLLDPEAMRLAALSGVDYAETDFPSAMNSLQPLQQAAASSPNPPNGATDVPPNVILQWLTGLNAVERRVWFGSNPPGANLGIQASDLLARTGLAPQTTYYWRVDEMTAGGTTTQGPVWSFTTAVGQTSGATLAGLWLFDRQNDPGHASIGNDLQIEGSAPGWSAAVSDDSGAQVGGVILTASGAASRLRAVHGIAPNGGGGYVNRYSIVMDILSPPASRSLYRSLLQTQTANGNDGDYFLRDSDSRAGLFDLTYGPVVDGSRWTRLIFTVDLQSVTSSSVLRTHLNAGNSYTHTSQPLDGRFSLDPSVLFFADEDGENPPLYVGMLAIYDGSLNANEVAALGGVRAEGLFPAPQPTLQINEGTVLATWPATPGYLLQYSDDLLFWTNIPATTGLGEWSEPIAPPKRFFRTSPR